MHQANFKRHKQMVRLITAVVVMVILAVVGIYILFRYLISPVNSQNTQTVNFTIVMGDTTAKISQNLQSKGLIRSSLAFEILVKISGSAGKIQAGDFSLSPSMDNEEILHHLMLGIADKKVTLLEGWRDEEMAQKLHNELGINQAEFLQQAKPGYMFPDTYSFNNSATVTEIISTLENNFNSKYTPSLKQQIEKQGLTPDQGVILASIVEREARSSQARTMVASILLKRLKIGMPLNTDASVQYILGFQQNENSWWKKELAPEDFKINSPFNTYLYSGLPPGPICNPSLGALEAVANADSSTPYLYYYHDSQGVAHYAKTLEEQNQNVANYP